MLLDHRWRVLTTLGCGLFMACGSDDSAAFEGRWQIREERSVYDCGDGEVKVEVGDPPYVLRLEQRGSGLALLEVDQQDQQTVLCTYQYRVDGARAVLDGTQSCKLSTDQGMPELVRTWTSDELVLDGDSLVERGQWSENKGCRGRVDSTYTRL